MSYHYVQLNPNNYYHNGLRSKSICCSRIPFRRTPRLRSIIIFILLNLLLIIAYIFGLFTHLIEKDYDLYFYQYPKKFPNFRYTIETIRSSTNGSIEYFDSIANNHSFIFPINSSPKCHNLILNISSSLPSIVSPIDLLILVKSAVPNKSLRNVIRKTWGYEKRFSDVTIRTVFMLGQCNGTVLNMYETLNCQQNIMAEQSQFNDLIQANFIDSYYNNTLKTLASLKWTLKHCSHVPYLLFVDDDFYVSIKNVLKFIRNFIHTKVKKGMDNDDQHSIDFDGRLYAGFVFGHSRPMRHLISKWYISLYDYPYNRYPPYVTGGCFIMNNRTIDDLYHASLYTKSFKYDDVYLGILAKRMEITLVHNDNIYFYKLNYDRNVYRNVIASHGYKNPEELMHVWLEQKSLGNA